MKIGNSTVQFNLSVNPQFKGYKVKDVPYWRLYARKGDCIGEGWYSTRSLSYTELVEYLTKYPRHRVLEAYPRKTAQLKAKYAYDYYMPAHEFIVIDIETGEVMFQANAKTAEITYHAPTHKNKYYFWNKFFKHVRYKDMVIAEYTPRAQYLMQ